MSIFGERLLKIIETRGINQRWLAEQAGTSEATISRYINGVHEPNISATVAIAKSLNVSVDYLVGISSSPCINGDQDSELASLQSCYLTATNREKKLIWSILDDYLPEDKKIIALQYIDRSNPL